MKREIIYEMFKFCNVSQDDTVCQCRNCDDNIDAYNYLDSIVDIVEEYGSIEDAMDYINDGEVECSTCYYFSKIENSYIENFKKKIEEWKIKNAN